MLSDSVFEAIQQLLKDIHHYSQPPFNYGSEYKQHFVIAICNLLYVQHKLDGCEKKMYDCMGEAYELYESSISEK